MKTEIIAVGTELLLGQIANTNAQFLSAELATAGFHVYHHTAVGDNPDRLLAVIRQATSRSECIILTGGLGPTKDDLTKETAAGFMGSQLVYDQPSLQAILDHFKKTGREMSENNRKQALVIEGSLVLPNDVGMAPGMLSEHEKKLLMLLPGPPSELKHMFTQYGLPALMKKGGKEPVTSRVLRFFGVGESMLETMLADMIESQTNPTIAPLAGEHEVTLRLSASFFSQDEAELALDETEKKILDRAGCYFYGYDSSTLEEVLLRSLQQSGCSLSAAESLTGGWFGKSLTDVSGASSNFLGSVVVYNNKMKEKLLGINAETLVNYGAVSKECAMEMADAVRKLTGSDYGISLTGAAGPAGDGNAKPGTVYIAISSGNSTDVIPLQLAGTRNRIRAMSVKHGLFAVWKKICAEK